MGGHLKLNPGSGRQRRKYTCQDCGYGNMIPRFLFTRRAKPRCGRCGCTRLDESGVAKVENAVRNDLKRGYLCAGQAKAEPELSPGAAAWAERHPAAVRAIRCQFAGDPTDQVGAIETAAAGGLDDPAFAVDDAVRYGGRRCVSFIKRVRFQADRWVYADTDGNVGFGNDFQAR